MAAGKLTAKQAMFVAEYLVDLNATQAAIRAGYSVDSAGAIATENLAKPLIVAAIDDALDARAAKTGITAERVLRELARIAFGDMRKVTTWGPDGVRLVESSELDDDAAAMVAEAGETTSKDGGSLKVKAHDKVKALELIGKHLAMFVDKVEHSGGGFALHVTLGTHAQQPGAPK